MSEGERALRERIEGAETTPPEGGPPPLAPFGLKLLHDARWSHEGRPILNRKLREKFDRSVVYLPDVGKYVVQVGHFRGEIEVEEAGFFVRSVDLVSARLHLSDGSEETLDPTRLEVSPRDGALICRVKRELTPGGLPARFSHAAQAELLGAVQGEGEELWVEVGGRRLPVPPI